ncbi:cyclin-related 2 family protein [Heterostelium album PN500]|uniref:Cyclin-related 2 family protein n=1 Tax=Heterostelium pallidum (strain ATCC 26659 / Pp 5 / PN500) TaxID=670386 RepID=D3BE06_HETP5|nr:cyclin-related 2 family protein [Heterostelium album PN500]EFA80137.1 cyclin-related 2 family protein [Heterostelium album PN500]|eukprot:XP_020432257.1 cyclin-related 2 family protein [Heterostelium album PN500]
MGAAKKLLSDKIFHRYISPSSSSFSLSSLSTSQQNRMDTILVLHTQCTVLVKYINSKKLQQQQEQQVRILNFKLLKTKDLIHYPNQKVNIIGVQQQQQQYNHRNDKNQRKTFNNNSSCNSSDASSEIIRAQNSLCIINNQQPSTNNNRNHSRNLQQQKKFNKNSVDNLSNLLDKSYITKPVIAKTTITTPPKTLSPTHDTAAGAAIDEASKEAAESSSATSSDVAEVAKKQSSSAAEINPIVMDDESIKLYLPLLHVTAEFIENQMDSETPESDEDPISSSFNAASSPNISVFQYLRRILKYTMFDEEIFVITVIYLDRLKRLNPKFQFNNLNIHRLIMTCALLSSKYQNEKSLDNRYYAQVGGVSLSEINFLELKLLAFLNYNLYIDREEFDKYLKVIQTGVDEYRRSQSPPQPVSSPSPPPTIPTSTTPPLPTNNNNNNNSGNLSSQSKPFRQKSNSYQTNGQQLNSFVNTINKAKPFHHPNYNTYPQPQPIYYNYQPTYQNVEYQSYVSNGAQQPYHVQQHPSYPYPVYPQPTVMYQQQDLTTPPSEPNSHAWNYYYSQPVRQQPQTYNHARYPQYPN